MNARSVSGGWGCRAPRRGVGRVLGALLGVAVGSIGGLGTVTAAGIGVAVLAGTAMTTTTASALTPDPVFGGTLTAAQQAEMMQWGQTYWNRLEGVPTAANTTFTFSTAAMNSPLFNPFYGPRQTLVNLGLIADGDCMKQLAEYPGTDAASAAKRQAIKDALVDFRFKTDPVTDPTGTTTHVIKILDASMVAGLVTYTEDGKLVSEKLPLDVLVAAGANVELADNLSADSITALLVLTNQAPGLVAGVSGATEAKAMLGGQATKANNVATAVAALLGQAGVGVDAVERMDALFGVYGQLPTVYVGLSDCAVLVDATTGAVTTPVKLGTPLDASGLLALHGEASAPYAHRMVSSMGCTFVAAPTWHATPPAGYPAAPAPAAPNFLPFIVPGIWPTSWTCVTVAPGPATRTNPFPTLFTLCRCTQDRWWRRSPTAIPALVPDPFFLEREICEYPGPCFAPLMLPSTTPPLLPGPSPTQVVTCRTIYWF